MEKKITFEDFWVLAIKASKHRNTPSYHPCCDTWSTRFSKSKCSHRQSVTWKKMMASLDRSIENKKQALQVKMREDGLQIPILLNQPCLYLSGILFLIIKVQNIRKLVYHLKNFRSR
jgi:hypothetical protein